MTLFNDEFLAEAVVEGLMQTRLNTGVPVLSVLLTPHQYRETALDVRALREQSVTKGREAAKAALIMVRTPSLLAT